MPNTAIVLTGDAIGQIAVLAFFFLLALYFVIKWAVVAALRSMRSDGAASKESESIAHLTG